jgi:hypothetical protein
MKKVIVSTVASLLLVSANISMAGGDAAAGKAKSATCAGCHGAAGISANPLWPNLAGQKDAYMVKQMKAFRDGKRSDPMMSPMAKPLSEVITMKPGFAGLFVVCGLSVAQAMIHKQDDTQQGQGTSLMRDGERDRYMQ